MLVCMTRDTYAYFINTYATCRVFMCKSDNISQEAFLFCVVYMSHATNRLHKVFNSSTAELKRAHIVL